MTAAAQEAAAVAALLAPLRFAARNNFAALERLKDLNKTLAGGLDRLVVATAQSRHAPRARALRALVPEEQLGRGERIVRLERLLAALQGWPMQTGSGPTAAIPAPLESMPAAAKLAPTSSAASAAARKAPAPARGQQEAPAAKVSAPPKRRAPVTPETPLVDLPGVGSRGGEQLAQRQLHTVADLLHFLPRRYQGVSGYQALGELEAGMVASVEGQISAVSDRFVRGRRTLEVVLVDGTGSLHLVWFRVPGRGFVDQFRRGHRLRAAGSIKRFRAAVQMVHPEIVHVADSGHEVRVDVGDAAPSDDDIIPLYLEVEGLHARSLRRIIAAALGAAEQLQDPLPEALRKKHGLVPLQEAIVALHAPPGNTSIEDLQEARTPWHRRLIYDELLALQLGLLWQRQRHHQKERGPNVVLEEPISHLARRLLPFEPTDAQHRVMGEIAQDMVQPAPMHRLLQGDVGSGKTAVALTAAYAAHTNGLQAAMMAPTELLAEQHARTAQALCAQVGMRVALLTGHVTGKARREVLQALRAKDIHLIVGTHALIQQEVVFGALGFAVVDEQHRFGVLQRARLAELGQASTGRMPHMLVMTATPIPRTLALTVYGDLDVSVIDALPPGRKPIVTVLHRDGERARVYGEVVAAVARGGQAYVVFPLVEDSDKEGMVDIRAAVSSADELAAGPLKNVRLGLLHGRLTADEKEAVMRAFARGDMDVLIATTVIEVGIDVPNASVMVIEHAERFGLSQLHQLRGRVGRGSANSTCYLLARARPSEDAWRRLDIMVQTQDGFRIAEEDLTIRGPGDFVGTRQSGLPVLTMANLGRDGAVLALARQDARALLAQDPTLTLPEHRGLRGALQGMWADRLRLLQVG